VLDGSALRFPLVLRGRDRGERFEPDGLAGKSSRLSDAMIDWKIPQRLRARWPLLVSGGRVAWIPGGRIGAGFAAGAGSIDPICVKLFRR
jgi:tRNA(Ile)-lysidine synthase